MTTARQVIYRALTKLGVREAETEIEAFEANDALDALNDMLQMWEEDGIRFGYVGIDNLTDELDYPPYAMAAIKSNLAVLMAPEYGKPISQVLVIEARDTLDKLIKAATFIGDVEFPDTLPIGSGNECYDWGTDRRFFNQNQKENF